MSKTYGQTVTFAGTEFTESGLMNGDTVMGVTLTSAGDPTDRVQVAGSPYAIIPSGAVGTGLANYTISYVNGGLAVETAALTITAASTSKTYGQTVTFAGTEFTESGLMNGDTVMGVTLRCGGPWDGTGGRVAHAIIPSGAVGTGLANYTISYVNGGLAVETAAFTITAESTSKKYGQTVTFAGTEFTESGLVNGDTVTGVTLTSPGAAGTAQVSGSPYAIVPSRAVGTGLGNYTITYFSGGLTVQTAALTIAAESMSKTYGQTVTFPGTEFNESGLVNGDTVTGVTLTSAGAAGMAPVAGSLYAITPSGAVGTGLANYAVSYVNGGLAIEAAALTITAASRARRTARR